MRFPILLVSLAAGLPATLALAALAAPPVGAAVGRAGAPVAAAARSVAPVRAVSPNAAGFSPAQRSLGNQSAAGRGNINQGTVGRGFVNPAAVGQHFGNQGAGGRGYGYAVPPFGVSRGWDFGHRHFWNNGYYGYVGGGWVLIDDGSCASSADFAPVEEALAPEPAPVAADSLAVEVQRALRKRGYSPGPINGLFDPQTRSAIAALQGDLGLETTGHVNARVLAALGIR